MKRIIPIAVALALLIVNFQQVSAAENSSELKIVSDEVAGCVYGTRPIATSDYLAPGTIKNNEQLLDAFNGRDKCSILFSWAPLANFPQGLSLVKVASGSNTDPETTEHLCLGASDSTCSAAKWQTGTLWAISVMYKCLSATDLNCISNIDVIDPSGNVSSANYLRNFPDTPEISGQSWEVNGVKTGYSKGGAVPLWEFKGPSGSVRIATTGIVERTWLSNGKNWDRPSATFQLSISPVRLVENSPGSTKPMAREVERNLPSGKTVTTVVTDSPNAAPLKECQKRLVMDTNSCLLKEEFPPGYSYRVTMQMPDDIPFFLNGRIQEPIAYTEAITGGHKVVIEGKPATSFVVAGVIPKAIMKSNLVDYLRSNQHLGARIFQSPGDMPPIENRYQDLLNIMLPYFGDYSTYEEVSWNLKSTPTLGSLNGGCLNEVKGQILGIVSTNATAFDGNPPNFEPGTKMISYQVAAPHFAVDGKSLNVGRYYMNANSKFLSCLLDVKKIPEVASVGIDYADGEKFVTTVTINSDKDWVRLKADNFHFSAPKIMVSFSSTPSQEAPNVANPGKPSNQSPSTKKVTINCVKGKTTKKITGVNPRCPMGYKRK